MFRAAHRSSSGALNCICSLWFICPYGDRPLPRLSRYSSAHSALVTAGHRMGIQTRGCRYGLELLMMSGVPLETCWAFKKPWNNKFYCNAASCWYFYWVIYDARIHEYQIHLHLQAEVKERVYLCPFSPSGTSWPFSEWTLPFSLTHYTGS